MLQPVLASTHSARCLGSWHLLSVRKEVSSSAWSAILLQASKVLDYESLLLTSQWSWTSLGHQVENSLAIFTLARVSAVHVTREVFLSCEVGVAQLAHQRAADDRPVTETAQLVSSDLATWDINKWLVLQASLPLSGFDPCTSGRSLSSLTDRSQTFCIARSVGNS